MAAEPTLAELLYESPGFHVDDDAAQGFALRKFCEALCTPMQPVYDLVRPRLDMAGWGIVLDANLCPAYALPYLAQYVGVQITPQMSELQIRNEIRQPSGWRRGQTGSIRIQTRATLDPAVAEPLVIVRPNTPEVGRHYVRTLLSQTPTPTHTAEVVRASVPAWSVVDYEAITGVAFTDVTASKYTTFTTLGAAFGSFQALTEALPTDL